PGIDPPSRCVASRAAPNARRKSGRGEPRVSKRRVVGQRAAGAKNARPKAQDLACARIASFLSIKISRLATRLAFEGQSPLPKIVIGQQNGTTPRHFVIRRTSLTSAPGSPGTNNGPPAQQLPRSCQSLPVSRCSY